MACRLVTLFLCTSNGLSSDLDRVNPRLRCLRFEALEPGLRSGSWRMGGRENERRSPLSPHRPRSPRCGLAGAGKPGIREPAARPETGDVDVATIGRARLAPHMLRGGRGGRTKVQANHPRRQPRVLAVAPADPGAHTQDRDACLAGGSRTPPSSPASRLACK